MLIDTRTRMQREVTDIFSDSAAKIREYGLDAAALVDTGLPMEELQEKIAQYGKMAEDLIEKTRTDADDHVHSCFLELGQSFTDMNPPSSRRTSRSGSSTSMTTSLTQ